MQERYIIAISKLEYVEIVKQSMHDEECQTEGGRVETCEKECETQYLDLFEDLEVIQVPIEMEQINIKQAIEVGEIKVVDASSSQQLNEVEERMFSSVEAYQALISEQMVQEMPVEVIL